eukprot:366462-Chlamydomonas_euryale.AAC.7
MQTTDTPDLGHVYVAGNAMSLTTCPMLWSLPSLALGGPAPSGWVVGSIVDAFQQQPSDDACVSVDVLASDDACVSVDVLASDDACVSVHVVHVLHTSNVHGNAHAHSTGGNIVGPLRSISHVHGADCSEQQQGCMCMVPTVLSCSKIADCVEHTGDLAAALDADCAEQGHGEADCSSGCRLC